MKKSKSLHRSEAEIKLEWIRSFEREVKKLSPAVIASLPISVALTFYESARYTPLSAAKAYMDRLRRNAYEHAQQPPKKA